MEVVLITRARGTRAHVFFGWLTGAAVLAGVAFMIGAAAFLGYRYAMVDMADRVKLMQKAM